MPNQDFEAENRSELPHWAEQIGRSSTCVNCGAEREGNFCHHCGEKHISQRIKFADLVKSLLARISNLDRGLLYTFVELTRRPGKVSREYISGLQKKYVNPLGYFFVGAALQLLVVWLLEDKIYDQFRVAFQQNPALAQQPTFVKLEEIFGEDIGTAFARTYLTAIKQVYSYAALLFCCFPFAVCLAWLHRLHGERFKLGETMVFSLYAVGQMLVISAFGTFVTMNSIPSLQGFVGPVVYLFVGILAHESFFERTWGSRIITIVSLTIAMTTFFASILAIFAISFLSKVWTLAPAG